MKTRVLIVGGGFAGASTAAALAKYKDYNVTLIEGEKVPGVHSSGRNASMARRVIGDPILSELAYMSVEGIRRFEVDDGIELIAPTGGLLIGQTPDVEALYNAASQVHGLEQDMRLLNGEELVQRVNVLQGATSITGIATAECGVVDIHALLSHYLQVARRGGVECLTNHRISDIEVEGDAIKQACINGEWRPVDVIINAAGFAANHVANMAGLKPLPLHPSRRHLFVTSRWDEIDPRWPFVWDISHGIYFRPESGGLLMCACDETPWHKRDVPVESNMRQVLAEKFSTYAPRLAQARPAHAWAGIRVLTPDDRFILGEDPRLQGFIWAAGLGGHGMTTSFGVGDLVARSLKGEAFPSRLTEALSPKRFLVSADTSFAA